MENRLRLIHCSLIWLVMFAGSESGGRADAQDQIAREPVYVAATVLDKKLYLRPPSQSVVAENCAKLSAKQFAKWKSESRWRPLVSKVSHRVMSDWAKRNNVRPTREELEKHFKKEAKQYLQAYATTPEGEKRVATAVMWASYSAAAWVRAKALHDRYGGRVAISSFGAWVAIDGRNALLKEYATTGKIHFHDPDIEKDFWVGVDSPAVLDVTISNQTRISRNFATPPWKGWGYRTAEAFKKNPLLSGLPKEKQDQPADPEPASE